MNRTKPKAAGPLRMQRRINVQLRKELRDMRARLARKLLDNENLQANMEAWRTEAVHWRKQYDSTSEELEQQEGQLDAFRHPKEPTPRKSLLAWIRSRWWL